MLTLESSQFYFVSLSNDTGILSQHYADTNPIFSIVNSVVCILSLCQAICDTFAYGHTTVFTFNLYDSYNKFEDTKLVIRSPTKEGQTMIYKTQHRKLKIVQRRKLRCRNTSCCSTYLTCIWVAFLLQAALDCCNDTTNNTKQ